METAPKLKALCQLFFNLARSEKKVEIIKQMLCQFPDFEPYTAYRRILRGERGVSASNLCAFLSENQLFVQENTVRRTFLARYDADRDDFLSFSE